MNKLRKLERKFSIGDISLESFLCELNRLNGIWTSQQPTADVKANNEMKWIQDSFGEHLVPNEDAASVKFSNKLSELVSRSQLLINNHSKQKEQ